MFSEVMLAIIVIYLVVISLYLYQLQTKYKKLTEGIEKGNLFSVLDNLIKRIEENKVSIEDVRKDFTRFSVESTFFTQKVGLLRFNPFADTGGDQSFILSILDGHDTGVVLTSLHTRGITRWYAKNVKAGKGVGHELSAEEIKAIKMTTSIRLRKE